MSALPDLIADIISSVSTGSAGVQEDEADNHAPTPEFRNWEDYIVWWCDREDEREAREGIWSPPSLDEEEDWGPVETDEEDDYAWADQYDSACFDG